MADVQSTYTQRQNKLFRGQKVDGEEYNAITQLCEDAAGIGFGVPVSRGTGDNGATILTVANVANFLGITLREVSLRPTNADKFAQYNNMPVMTSGSVAGKIDGAVTRGAPVRYDTSTGNFTAAAVAGNIIGVTNWFFGETGANGDIVKLYHRA
jgi:hypothetical protein